MTPNQLPIAPALSLASRRGVALLFMAVGLTLLQLGAAGAQSGLPGVGPQQVVEADPGVLPGRWTTFANGDDVLALALDGSTVWAGTRAGGLVKWIDGEYVQYLHPQDPLPSNTVHDLAIDAGSRLWIATNRGLTMFDHRGTPDRSDDIWRTYTSENSFGGLPSNDVRAVAIDGNVVWVGAHQIEDPLTGAWQGGGLGRLDTKGTPATADDTWASVATYDGTRSRLPNGTEQFGLISDNVNDILMTPGGRMWVATSSHHIYDDEIDRWPAVHGGVTLVETQETASPDDDVLTGFSCEDDPLTIACQVMSLEVDTGGWVWGGTRGRGVMYWRANGEYFGSDGSQRFTEQNGLPAGEVYGVAAGRLNEVWLATAEGLARLTHQGTLPNRNDDEWLTFDRSDGLTRDMFQAVAADDTFVWAGTGPEWGVGGGLVRLSLAGGSPTAFRTSVEGGGSAPATNFLRDIAVGPAGSRWEDHVWIATGSSQQRLFGEGVMDLDTKGTSAVADDAWAIHTAVSTDDDGSAPWTGLAGDNVHAIAIDGDAVWFGSTESVWSATDGFFVDGGVTVHDGNLWTARTAFDTDLSDNSVADLEIGCDGEIWIATGSPWEIGMGLDRLVPGSLHAPSGDTWENFVYPDVPSNRLTAVSADCASASLWASGRHHTRAGRWSDGGASRLDTTSGTWTLFDTRNGLVAYANEGIRAEATTVETGPGGVAWVGSYGTSATTESLLIRTKPYWPAVLNTFESGTWSHEIFENMGWVADIEIDAQGRLWVATSRGGAARDAIDPESWREDRNIPGMMLKTHDGWVALDVETSGLPANDITAIALGHDGEVWVTTEGWGLARYDPNELSPTPTPTSDAPSPTPSRTPTASPTRSGTEPTPTGTSSSGTPGTGTPGTPGTPGTARTPTRTSTRATGTTDDYLLFAPAVHQRARG